MSGQGDMWLSAQKLVSREGLLLDNKDWDTWLDLYTVDAIYWVPAWSDSGEPTSDPKREVSLIYYSDRTGLEDRVFRLRSGKSAASNLETRTCHFSQLMDVSEDSNQTRARTNWLTQSLIDGLPVTLFGWADYRLRRDGEAWRIASKKTILVSDRPNTVVDFYLI